MVSSLHQIKRNHLAGHQCSDALPQQRRYRNVGLGISLGLAAFLIVVDQVES